MSDILIATATTLQEDVLERSGTPDFSVAKWPLETDIVLPAKGLKPLLSNQKPLVHSVVHDAIKNMLAMILFDHAFPDSAQSTSFANECLTKAAEKQVEKGKPGAMDILSRLKDDAEYLDMLNHLVSFIIMETT